jgi:hypothetical protein
LDLLERLSEFKEAKEVIKFCKIIKDPAEEDYFRQKLAMHFNDRNIAWFIKNPRTKILTNRFFDD